MKFYAAAIALTLTMLMMGGCAHPRPCPPGYHLGPAGMACRIN